MKIYIVKAPQGDYDSVYKAYIENCAEVDQLKQQLHSQPAEIVGKIRSKCCVEDKCKDGSFVLGINEKDLDTILKEYQK